MQITIDLPDEKAAALLAEATAHGMSLEQWLAHMAMRDGASGNGPEEKDDAAFARRRDAVEAILELQKHVKPDPEGWTIRDYINYGRR